MSLPSPSARASLATLSAPLPAGSVLHLWLKALTEAEASLSVTVEAQPIASPATRRTGEFAFVAVPLSAGGLTALSYDPAVTMLSVAYAFHPDRVTAEGITVLHHEGRNAPPLTPDSYHFRPPFGWMNDPNGFGRFGGTAHLFYQHYPHSLRWNTMHWGHAISTDFLHWTHQPVFLFPADHLSEKDDGRGGAFSGSAIAAGDAIRVFYTEHVIDRTPEEQIQLTAVSQDGLLAGASDIILPLRPKGSISPPTSATPMSSRGRMAAGRCCSAAVTRPAAWCCFTKPSIPPARRVGPSSTSSTGKTVSA